MFNKKQNVKHRQLVRDELGESLDHALRAAEHAASGVRSMGPKVAPAADRARSAAHEGWDSTKAVLAPIAETAQSELKQARKRAQKERAKLQKKGKAKLERSRRGGGRGWATVGLLAGGVALGAIVAAVLRQRKAPEWDEYGADDATEPAGGDPSHSAKPNPDRAAGGE